MCYSCRFLQPFTCIMPLWTALATVNHQMCRNWSGSLYTLAKYIVNFIFKAYWTRVWARFGGFRDTRPRGQYVHPSQASGIIWRHLLDIAVASIFKYIISRSLWSCSNFHARTGCERWLQLRCQNYDAFRSVSVEWIYWALIVSPNPDSRLRDSDKAEKKKFLYFPDSWISDNWPQQFIKKMITKFKFD